jgi:serine/threonine-protein kinase ATR
MSFVASRRAAVFLALGSIVGLLSPSLSAKEAVKPKPLFRDFMGLNVHTVLFKPELYHRLIRLVRDYHGFKWDVGDDSSYTPQFPMARNGVDWQQLYGTWKKMGYQVDVSLMFDDTSPKQWKDLPKNAHDFGYRFAKYFGPSGEHTLVTSMEIGNEPGNYPDADYRILFENAAKGLREGDPRLKVVTGAADVTPSGSYHKSLETLKGLNSLYDVINLHTYAQVEGYPTWKRSYPEDPKIPYLQTVRNVIGWRNRNAPGKEVWITEFGYDSTTQPQEKEGDFKQWVGVTDTQQAQYIVRSWLVFSTMDVARAYLFFFDDNDEPHVHGSSGVTRKFKPKPSFYAVAHLQKSLGDYRFSHKVIEKPGDLYLYEFRHATNPKRKVWVAWSPTGSGRETLVTLPKLSGEFVKDERMPLTSDNVMALFGRGEGDRFQFNITESPLYIWWRSK